ncbi:unnamed protein product [Closterium sp. Naga37s-1]|nr:unnamed protein product [Closterium sp. Naga37s-1]
MAHTSSSLPRVLTFAVLYSSLWLAILPRSTDAVSLSYVLSQLTNMGNTGSKAANMSAAMVEFAAGYDKVTDIGGCSLLVPYNDGWTRALAGYKTKNPSATTASDPILEALSTVVNSPGSVAPLNAMSANAKNALSRLAKFLAVATYIAPMDMVTGSVSVPPLAASPDQPTSHCFLCIRFPSKQYKTGRFSLSTEVNQPVYLYGNASGSPFKSASLDHAFTGTDRGSDASAKNGLMAGVDAGGPKAVAGAKSSVSMTSTTSILDKTTSSSQVSATYLTDVVFPANMGSLTSTDAVGIYGKGAGRLAKSLGLIISLVAAVLLF